MKNKSFIFAVLAFALLITFFYSITPTFSQQGCGADCGGEPHEHRGGQITTTTTTTPFCGDGVVQNGEQCELPNTNNNPYCPQTTSTCSGNKTGTRDAFGNCNGVCGCVNDPFTYNCVKNSCGAECSVNSDCQPKCVGDIRYFNGTCGSTSCSCSFQSENCNNQDGWYDTSNFTCDGACRRCKNQEFRNYGCTPGACTYTVNATRTVCENAPSGNHCVNGNFTTSGYCGSSSPYCGNGCSVKIDRFECNGNNQCNQFDFTDTSFCPVDTSCSGGVCSSNVSCGSGGDVCTDSCTRAKELLRCNGFGSCSNFWKTTNATSCNPYTCSSGSCTSTCSRDCGAGCNSGEEEIRNVSCTTSQNCPGTKLQKRVCLTGNCSFGDWFDITTCQDTPGDFCPPVCGDGIVNGNETCEPPNSYNNSYCPQTTSDCFLNKTGTRDAFGNCNGVCGCVNDPFTYNCVKNSCGAECSVNSDCQPKCLNDRILLTNGLCSGSSCSCRYTQHDCSRDSGWVDTGNTRTISCPDDACKICGQKEQEFRNFFCSNDGCGFSVTDTRWVEVNRTVVKCPTGYFCVQGVCEKKECKGNVDLEIDLQICPNKYVRAHVSGLVLCTGKRVYLREESCEGRILGTCVLNRNGECVRNLRFKDIGTPTVVACLDKDSDSDFIDSGEQDSVTLNVNCNNCEFSQCPLSVCNKCDKCGGTCNANTNQYGESRCLNPGESCVYSCVQGSCGATICTGNAEDCSRGACLP